VVSPTQTWLGYFPMLSRQLEGQLRKDLTRVEEAAPMQLNISGDLPESGAEARETETCSEKLLGKGYRPDWEQSLG